MEIWGQITPTKMRLMTKNHILRRSARTELFGWRVYFFQNHFFNSNLCNMCWEIFLRNKKWNFMKIDHFLGHFPARKSRIWHIKFISWRSEWKNEENVHLRFLIFENSSHRYLQNLLRDFQKSWNHEKIENGPFCYSCNFTVVLIQNSIHN